MTFPTSTFTRRAALVLGLVAVALFAFFWWRALSGFRLPFAERTWMQTPAFGADFWSQSDYAARLWKGGVDPYENERHLFHYPPIVIRLFLWTPYLTVETALRIWILVLVALVTLAVVLASRTRRALGAGEVPLAALLGLVLFTFPIVYTLERSNFDLITLGAMLLAVPLLGTRDRRAEILAGVLLSFAPWVKIYPGFLGLALLALRRFWAFAGFVLGGAAIFLAMPAETLRSFQILRIAIERVRGGLRTVPFAPWSHSLSIGWVRLVESLSGTSLYRPLSTIPGTAVALVLVLVPAFWVCRRVFRARATEALTFPLLLWTVAMASFVPEIANDYSLAFLPIAAASVLGAGESLSVRVAVLLSLIAYQPIALPISGAALLVLKYGGALAIGGSIVGRAESGAPHRSTRTL